MGGVGDDITPEDVDTNEFEVGKQPEYYIKLYQAGLIDEPSAREKIQQMMKQKGIDQNGNY